MPKLRSATTTHGRNMAGARALWRATGMTDQDFGKPIIAVVNSFTQFVPGHVHLKDLGQLVAREIETAGGIVQVLPLLGSEPFLVINGDTWLDLDYRALVNQPLGDDLAHLWLVPNPPQHPQGDFSLQAGRVLDTPALTFSGVGLYHPAAFAGLPCGARKLAPLLRDWMALGRVGGSLLAGEWRDIGTVDRLRELDEQLLAGTH